MSHPYIPLYVDDYEAATAHLTPEEDGVYNRLLRLCWRTPGCSIPNDPAWIARKIRITLEDFERVAAPIISEFFAHSRGRLVQRRLKREYDTISWKLEARKNAGKKGGSAKALKTKEKASSNATVLPADTRAYQNQNQNQSSVDKSTDDAALSGDPNKDAWTLALRLLSDRAGLTETRAKQFFGRLLSENGVAAADLYGPLAACVATGTSDPQAYLTKAARGVASRRAPAQPKRVGFV